MGLRQRGGIPELKPPKLADVWRPRDVRDPGPLPAAQLVLSQTGCAGRLGRGSGERRLKIREVGGVLS